MKRSTQITAAVVLLLAVFAIGAGAAGADDRPDDKPKGPKELPGGGKKWGGTKKPGDSGNTPPATFDPAGAGLWASTDCEEVREGAQFWPAGEGPDRNPWIESEKRYTYDPATARGRACVVTDVRGLATAAKACSGRDYVDGVILEMGIEDPIAIAQRIAADVAPLCWDAPPDTWPAGFADWYQSLVERLTDYVPEKVMWLDETSGG